MPRPPFVTRYTSEAFGDKSARTLLQRRATDTRARSGRQLRTGLLHFLSSAAAAAVKRRDRSVSLNTLEQLSFSIYNLRISSKQPKQTS